MYTCLLTVNQICNDWAALVKEHGKDVMGIKVRNLGNNDDIVSFIMLTLCWIIRLTFVSYDMVVSE